MMDEVADGDVVAVGEYDQGMRRLADMPEWQDMVESDDESEDGPPPLVPYPDSDDEDSLAGDRPLYDTAGNEIGMGYFSQGAGLHAPLVPSVLSGLEVALALRGGHLSGDGGGDGRGQSDLDANQRAAGNPSAGLLQAPTSAAAPPDRAHLYAALAHARQLQADVRVRQQSPHAGSDPRGGAGLRLPQAVHAGQALPHAGAGVDLRQLLQLGVGVGVGVGVRVGDGVRLGEQAGVRLGQQFPHAGVGEGRGQHPPHAGNGVRLGQQVPHAGVGVGVGQQLLHAGVGVGRGQHPPHAGDGVGVGQQVPHAGDGVGVGQQVPHAGDGVGVGQQLPHAGTGVGVGQQQPHTGAGVGLGLPQAGVGVGVGQQQPHAGVSVGLGRSLPQAGVGAGFGQHPPHDGAVVGLGQQQPHAGVSVGLGQQQPHAGAGVALGQQQPHAGVSVGLGQQQQPHAGAVVGLGQPQPHAGVSVGLGQQQPHAGVDAVAGLSHAQPQAGADIYAHAGVGLGQLLGNLQPYQPDFGFGQLLQQAARTGNVAAAPQPEVSMCRGVTVQDIANSSKLDHKEDYVQGFFHLVGDAIRHQATHVSQRRNWPYENHVKGFLWDIKSQKPTWECIEVNATIGFRKVDVCRRFVAGPSACCIQCQEKRKYLFRLCRAEVDVRDDLDNHTTQPELMRNSSPTLWIARAKVQSRDKHRLQVKNRRLNATIERMRAQAERIPNVNAEVLFGDEADWKRRYKEMMDGETDLEKKEIFALLQEEMEVVRRRKLKFGDARGHEWSSLMLQYCVCVRFGVGASSGMTNAMWDFVSSVFNLPTGRTLMRYAHADTSSPDGPCLETILQHAELLDHLAKDLEHPMRYGKISCDSHTVKERFSHDPNTNDIVGVAYDAFEPDVIVEEFKRLKRESARADAGSNDAGEDGALVEEEGKEPEPAEDSDDEGLAKGRHYMVFSWQNWSSKHQSVHFVVARYALATHSSRFLRKANRTVLAVLGSFHIYGVGNAFDGASDNRSWIKWTLTYTLKDLLGDMMQSDSEDSEDSKAESSNLLEEMDVAGEKESEASDAESNAAPAVAAPAAAAPAGDLASEVPPSKPAPPLDPTPRKFTADELPWDLLVAYDHPSIDGLIVLSLADMSHGIKKEANGVERGNLCDKDFLPCNMDMFRDVYMARRLMDLIRALLEIFDKNAKNRMRVSHAAKLHSNTMLRCIEMNAHKIAHKIPVEQWAFAKRYIRRTNRWVDVMNNSKDKGCEYINTVDHPHIFELLDYVMFLYDWKKTVHPDNFFPESTYEDVVWTCTGVVLTARIYLPRWAKAGYKDEDIVQRRHGTDDLEKLFCKTRGGNVNADVKSTNNMISGTVHGPMIELGMSRKANCGKRTTFHPSEFSHKIDNIH